MADRYVFADEAGNFDFSLKVGASRYFILTTVTMDDCRVGDALAHLRRTLTWRGHSLPVPFHATEDTPAVRSAVFDLLMRSSIRIDATVLEKHLQSEVDRPRRRRQPRHEEDATTLQRCGRRRGQAGFPSPASRCLLGRRQRSLHSGRRLLLLGRSTRLGAGRLFIPEVARKQGLQ